MASINGFRAAGLVSAAALGFSLNVVPAPAFGQVRERDVTVTGPRGRTLERDMRSVVTPGGIDRQTTIRRPGGATLERDVHISRPVPFGGGGPGPRWSPPPGRTVIERNVFVNGGGGRGGLTRGETFGIGAAIGTGAGLLLGRAFSNPAPPPPPAYYVEQPVIVAAPPPVYVVPLPPPVVMVNPPVRYQQGPPTLVVDPVAQAIGRLSSSHDNSRKEGALVLGRLGDPRAVDPLIAVLKADRNVDVRVAAATALGEIGDPRGAVVLERATIYEKKPAVRDAAALALSKFPRPQPQPQPAPTTSAPSELRPLDYGEPESVPPPPSPAGSVRRP